MTRATFKCVATAPRASLVLRAGLLSWAAFSLAGCTDRLATGATISDDYRERHPIVLTESPVTLNLFPTSKLDDASRRRVVEFAGQSREAGASVIEILVPVGALNEAQNRSALPAIKAALAAGGSAAALSVGSYPAPDARTAAPLRLAYRTLTARVPHRCGEWPADLASASSTEGWDNRPYWNLGCSYQNMIARQVDDPRDLEAPRAESPGDVKMRTRAIEKVRQGIDPSTAWATAPAQISK